MTADAREWAAFARERDGMVRFQIEARGVRDPRVLTAMRAVPRHCFVPQSHQEAAYADHPLPIGHGQTISQPYIVALMTSLLDLRGDETVLEIGTGCGYQTAVLASLARRVCSLEIVPTLAQLARERLAALGFTAVEIRVGNGWDGWPAPAPAFDAIIVTAAPDEVPSALVAQLAPGGRLVVPVGTWSQDLLRLTRDADGKVRSENILGVRFVPMVGRPSSPAPAS